MAELNPIVKEIKLSLNELELSNGVNVGARLREIRSDILSIGQELSLIRQVGTDNIDLAVEQLECRCWKLMDWIEEMQ